MRQQAKTDVQIRGVPVKLRDQVRRRAAERGLSMSRYLLDLIAADIARPSWKEWIREVEKRPTVMTTMTAAEAIREERRAEGSDE